MTTIAMAVQDELQRLTGTAGNPFETVTATGTGTGRYLGPERAYRMRAVIGSTVSGTNPTLDVKFQDSADGVTYADMGVAFAQLTASHATTTGSLSAFPLAIIHTTASRPWVRIHKTIGGTASPTFTNFAVLPEPVNPW